MPASKPSIQSFTPRQNMLSQRYEVYHYRDSHIGEVALHHHDFYEVYLFLSGDVAYTVENRTYPMRPGDILLISPLELHQPRIRQSGDIYERMVLWIDRGYLEQLSTDRTSLTRAFDTGRPEHSNLIRLTPTASRALQSEMERLAALTRSGDYGADLLAQSRFLGLMVELNRAAAAAESSLRQDYVSDRVVDAVLAYINEHYAEPLTLDELAARFYVSKYHLLRKFNAQVGAPVHRYILQKRLQIARQLMADGMTPTEACRHCGFGDYVSFYRAFKAEYQVSPKDSARGGFPPEKPARKTE